MGQVRIEVVEADSRSQHYGIRYESPVAYRVTGRGVHNPSFPHRVKVWDNTMRPNDEPERFNSYTGRKTGPGAYVDPFGLGTDDLITVTVSSGAIVISAYGPRTAYADDALRIGDTVDLVFPDGRTVPLTLVARSLADPVLVRQDQPALT